MILSPMRYKDYVWPHNPRVYEIAFKRPVVAHKVPFGTYVLQNLGRSFRVLRGDGEFCGAGAYDEFKKLATVFYDNEPGLLIHPVWQNAKAYFVSLEVNQEPREDYVKYSFEFWECYEGYAAEMKQVSQTDPPDGGSGSQASFYTVVYGDCLWNIANRNNMTLDQLVALNPQIKNPNLIYPGDQIRLS